MRVHGFSSEQFSLRGSFTRVVAWHRSLSDELAEKLWHAPDELMALGEPLQDKERCLVVRLCDGPDLIVVKHHNWGGSWKTFCKSLRTPQARQSFLDGVFLSEAGVRTPQPLALVERKLGPFGRDSYLLTEHVRGTSLYRWIRFEHPPLELVRHVIDQVVGLCARLVELRVSHNDLKPENLMIDPAGQVWLIDLEKMRRHDSLPPARVRLLEDLVRLLHPRTWRENRQAGELLCRQLVEHPVVAEAVERVKPRKHPLFDLQAFDRGQANQLSVLVVSPNGVENLRACIDSFRDIANQIVVADGRPTDEARQLVAELGCQLTTSGDELRETTAEFRNRALAQTRHPWVLVVEGDERVSPDLAKEIQCLLTEGPSADAYRIPQRRVYLGHVSKFGAFRGESPVRLFRRGLGAFVAHRTRARLETQVDPPGRTKSKLIYFYCWHVADLVRSTNEQTTHLAHLRFENGERPRFLLAIFRAGRRFVRSYLLRHAYLDGHVGLQMSLLSASAVLMTEAKLWELHYGRRQQMPSDGRRVAGVRLFHSRELRLQVAGEPPQGSTPTKPTSDCLLPQPKAGPAEPRRARAS